MFSFRTAAAGVLTALVGCVPLVSPDPSPAVGWAQVDAGQDASCGVTVDGEAFCWTHYPWAGLPYDSLATRYVPRRVPGLGPAREVAAERDGFCALEADGALHCWGDNHGALLGIGVADTVFPAPVRVPGAPPLAALHLAERNGCALTPEGHTYCWGMSHEGRLGTDPAALEPCGLNRVNLCAPTPLPVLGAPPFRALTVAGFHRCGVTFAGEAYCWGFDDTGAFGNGTTGGSPVPVPAAGGLRLASVAAGDGFTCGLDPEGVAHCWGNHNFGQLGTPWAPEHDDPRCNQYGRCSLVPVRVATGERFTALTAGEAHVCALTADGRLRCWGDNSRAQLAGRTADRCGYYEHVPCSQTPVPVLPRFRFRAVSAGEMGTCGITVAGSLFCWGYAGEVGGALRDWAPQRIVAPPRGG